MFITIDRIRTRRLKLGMSYQDLGSRTGINKSTLQRYEAGIIKSIPPDKLESIAKGLYCNVEYLLGNTDDPGDSEIEIPAPVKKGRFADRKPNENGGGELFNSYMDTLPGESLIEDENYLQYLKNKYGKYNE